MFSCYRKKDVLQYYEDQLVPRNDSCEFCFNLISDWSEHVKYCPFIFNLLSTSPSFTSIFPANGQMMDLNARIKTYTGHYQPRTIDFVESGFYLEKPHSLRCFFCDVSMKKWKWYDNPTLRHLEINPRCVYARFRYIIQPSKKNDREGENLSKDKFLLKHMRFEKERLKSFNCWPRSLKVSPECLAKAGFFYLGKDVHCAFCENTFSNLKPNEDPMQQHMLKNPECPFLRGKGDNVPMKKLTKTELDSLKKPMNKKMKNLHMRITSFAVWPFPPMSEPTVSELAAEGFYYTGKADLVSCHWCGYEIDDLEGRNIQDIAQMHQTNHSECLYIHFHKSLKIIQKAKEELEEITF